MYKLTPIKVHQMPTASQVERFHQLEARIIALNNRIASNPSQFDDSIRDYGLADAIRQLQGITHYIEEGWTVTQHPQPIHEEMAIESEEILEAVTYFVDEINGLIEEDDSLK